MDRGYESGPYEEPLREALGVVPMVKKVFPLESSRKRNSKLYVPHLQYLAIVGGRVVETVGSMLHTLFPKRIHRVTEEGFILKVPEVFPSESTLFVQNLVFPHGKHGSQPQPTGWKNLVGGNSGVLYYTMEGYMDRRRFFRILGAGGLFGLLRGKAQPAPWDKKTFETMKTLGSPLSEYGSPSPFEEEVVRYISPNLRTRTSRADFAPLEKLDGVMTPNGLFFERRYSRWTSRFTGWLSTA